ncbi:MAG: TetR/AcrR family transcriptional regulator [Coriobacteriia bacterium]|nr:TetR/AcrR family transcriptional regulator [Coriobacteriia bacterium]
MEKIPRVIADEAHRRFLVAFKELYAVNGMKGLSAAALSAKTGYSRSTFYRYFESVYDLLVLVEVEATPYENMAYLVRHANEVDMTDITHAFLTFFEEKEQLIRVLMRHRDDNRYCERMHECIKPAFQAQAERVYIMEPAEYEVMAEYLTEAKLSLLKAWALSDIDMNLGHMTKVTDSVLEGGFWDRVQAAADAHRAGEEYQRIPLSYFESIHPWIADRPLLD